MSTDVMQAPHLTTSRLLLLGVSSVVLCISFVMSLFAPFPLALAIVLYGRAKGYLVALAGLGASFVFAKLVFHDFTLVGFYFTVAIFAAMIAEVLKRNINPVKGIVGFGLVFTALVSGFLFVTLKQQNLSVEQYIVQQLEKATDQLNAQKEAILKSSDKDSLAALTLLENPKLLATEMKESLPRYFFVGVFLMLWFNMFLALKSRRLLQSGHDFPYSENDLLRFKVPFPVVFALVLALVMAVWGKDLGYASLEPIGMTLVIFLGIFYFFQGFGVFSDLLNFLGIFGFFRTLLVIFVIYTAYLLIVAAGLFDNWFDFRKYFVNAKPRD